MKLAENRFKRGLEAGEAQLGLWISLCSNVAAEVVAPAGFDWALIDTEHSANDYFSVLSQLQVFAAYPATTPIVRVEWNDAVAVKRMLDLGAPGLLFPMIQSAEEAKAAVAATRYPPDGVRGVALSTRATKYGRVSDYAARAAEETAVLLQVETREGLDHVAEIAAVEGVTGIFFGPSDIAASLGRLGKPNDPDVWEAIREAAEIVKAAGVPAGTLVQDAGFARQLVDEGFAFVACGTDAGLLARAADNLLNDVKGG